MIFLTLALVIAGSITNCFSFYFHGLAGYALNLLDYSDHREYSIIQLGLDVRKSYENPNAPEVIFTQVSFPFEFNPFMVYPNAKKSPEIFVFYR